MAARVLCDVRTHLGMNKIFVFKLFGVRQWSLSYDVIVDN